VLGHAETILLRYLVVFGGTCEPGEAGRHKDEGDRRDARRSISKTSTDHGNTKTSREGVQMSEYRTDSQIPSLPALRAHCVKDVIQRAVIAPPPESLSRRAILKRRPHRTDCD
jgi:hypothetical protein